MLVVDPAPIGGVEPAELVSGADRVIGLSDGFEEIDPLRWQPRRVAALLEESAGPGVEVWRLGAGLVLIEAVGEPPLLLATAPPAGAGRWGRDAVVVAMGDDVTGVTVGALAALGPRLIAVAGGDDAVGAALDAVRDRLDETGFMALEAGLAVEI
mgnify:CR=1 FL=1